MAMSAKSLRAQLQLLAVQTGTRVFCPAYRLAPEAPCPAAVEDALESY